MRKTLFLAAAAALLLHFYSCKKSDDNMSSSRTVQSFTGSYMLTSLVWTSNGVSSQEFDSLPICERDNIIQLNADLSANFIDTGVVCSPSLTASGAWSLSPKGDTLYLDTQGLFIKSWDGKTLVYTGIVDVGPPLIMSTVTLVKQ